jgi:hypothetical protein
MKLRYGHKYDTLHIAVLCVTLAFMCCSYAQCCYYCGVHTQHADSCHIVYMHICNDMLSVLICTGSDGSPARQRDAGLDVRQDITGVSWDYCIIATCRVHRCSLQVLCDALYCGSCQVAVAHLYSIIC